MDKVSIYASNLEKKLIDEFKQKFKEKLGYQPVVLTKIFIDNNFSIPLMSLEQLSHYFEPFFVEDEGKKIELFTKSRKREVVELRMIFCFIARQMNYTYKTIGQHLGDRDHTTIIHNVMTFKNLIDTDDTFTEKYTQILNHIKVNHEPSTLDQFNEIQCESESLVLPGLYEE
jgi:hypothetical protein